MQDGVVDIYPITLIITSLDVKGAFPNKPHRILRAISENMKFPFLGFLHAYLAPGLYAIQTDVGTNPWIQPSRRVPKGGREDHFLF